MKHSESFMAAVQKVMAEAKLNHDPHSPPASISCSLGHTIKPVWRKNRFGDHWTLRSPEDCLACKAQEARADYIDVLLERFKRIGVPEVFQVWTTGWRREEDSHEVFREELPIDEHNAHIAKACIGYSMSAWMGLAGSVGTGKTSYASALFMDLVESYRSRGLSHPLWTTEAAMFRECDLAAEINHSARVAKFNEYLTSKLLLLDDLGGSRRSLTPWQKTAMNDLFDYRYSHRLPVIFTTNLKSWDDIKSHYGDRITSRMLARCKRLMILMGPDRRLK